VRFYLKDGERRPDPQPVQTDDRKAMLTGLILWGVALVLVLVLVGADDASWRGLAGTCVVGVVLGLALLGYTARRRRRG